MKTTERSKHDPDQAELDRASIMVEKGQFAKAASLYTSMIDRYKEDPHLHALRGYALYRDGRFGEAIGDLQFASDKNPRAFNTLFVLGRCYGEVGLLDKALSCFSRVIQGRPETADAYTEIGLIMKFSGERMRAREMLEKALKLNSKDSLAKSALADLEI